MEDLSDRELKKILQENTAAKLFCDFGIKEKYDKLNNETLPKVAVDPQARIGCKQRG